MSWIHNDKVISENVPLSIEDIWTTNQGDYICTAKNEHGMATLTFSINVLSKSHFLAPFVCREINTKWNISFVHC